MGTLVRKQESQAMGASVIAVWEKVIYFGALGSD
jgi:hypothetical protein